MAKQRVSTFESQTCSECVYFVRDRCRAHPEVWIGTDWEVPPRSQHEMACGEYVPKSDDGGSTEA